MTVRHMLGQCLGGDVAAAARTVRSLWDAGYAASDIIGTIFKVRARAPRR